MTIQTDKNEQVHTMGINTPKNNRIDETAADQHLIDGFTRHAATITTMAIGGASLPTKDIIATLQSRIDSTKTVLSTRATWQTAVQADRAVRDKTKTTVSGVKQGLLVALAGHLDTLADFGLTARQKHVATPEQKLAAAAKAKSTRAARHTMGSKQKQQVKGTITTIVSPPAVDAPAPIKPAPVASAPNPGTTAGAGTSPVANAPTPVAGASAAAASHGT